MPLSSPIRILFLVTRADSFGGSSVHVRDMSCRLRAEGHEVLVGVGGTGPVTAALTDAGIPWQSLRYLGRSIAPWRDLRGLGEIRTLIRVFQPDIVSTHTAKAGALGRLAAWSCGVPAIYTPHCWSFGKVSRGGELFLQVERLVRPFGRRVICVSEDERVVGIERRLGPAEHFVTVHNGMPDIPPELRAQPAGAPPMVVMIGRFEEQKNHVALIRALAEICELPWRLKLVGDGPLLESARDVAMDLGVLDRVEFMGFRTDAAQILAEAQVYALHSHWEGFARSIVEALRAGLPVVACDVGGNAEAVIHGHNGFILADGDHEAWVDALKKLLADIHLRVDMGQKSRARYENELTFEAMYRKTVAVYHDVLKSAGKVPDVQEEPKAVL